MTDNEIVEALKLCTTQDGSIPCYDCPCWNDYEQECEGIDYTGTLDLINRQQAENKELAEAIHNLTIEKDALFDKAEELKAKIERLKGSVIVNNIMESQKIKREAYKEFAERLKEKSFKTIRNYGLTKDVVEACDINNLVKEMVGEEE